MDNEERTRKMIAGQCLRCDKVFGYDDRRSETHNNDVLGRHQQQCSHCKNRFDRGRDYVAHKDLKCWQLIRIWRENQNAAAAAAAAANEVGGWNGVDD